MSDDKKSEAKKPAVTIKARVTMGGTMTVVKKGETKKAASGDPHTNVTANVDRWRLTAKDWGRDPDAIRNQLDEACDAVEWLERERQGVFDAIIAVIASEAEDTLWLSGNQTLVERLQAMRGEVNE